MEWLISARDFKSRDRRLFDFKPSHVFNVNVIKIEGGNDVRQTSVSIANIRATC